MSIEYRSFRLGDLLKDAVESRIVLPNFQRDYVWAEDQQKKLIASALLKMPIGSWLFLSGDSSDFSFRPVGRVSSVDDINNEKVSFLLDGQQRLSTLCSAFSDLYLDTGEEWETVHTDLFPRLRYRWFLNIYSEKDENISKNSDFGISNFNFEELSSLEPDSLKDNLIVRKITKDAKAKKTPGHPNLGNDYPGEEGERLVSYCVENGLVPLYLICGDYRNVVNRVIDGIADKRIKKIIDSNQWVEHFDLFKQIMRQKKIVSEKITDDELKSFFDSYFNKLANKWKDDFKSYLDSIMYENIPVTILPMSEMGRASVIFDTMNSAGTPLSTFDLFSARWAAKSKAKTLSEVIKEFAESEIEKFDGAGLCDQDQVATSLSLEHMGVLEEDSIAKIFREQFLNLLSINIKFSDKPDAEASLDWIKRDVLLKLNPEKAIPLIEKTVRSLVRMNLFCIYRLALRGLEGLPYVLMSLPISSCLSNDDVWKNRKQIDLIEWWYWVSIFSGHYRDQQNRKTIEDLTSLRKFIEGGDSAINVRFSKIFTQTDYSDHSTFLPFNEAGLMIDGNESVPGAIRDSFLSFLISTSPRKILEPTKKIRYVDCLKEKINLEVHHLIPLGSGVNRISESTKTIRKDKTSIYNSVLNLALIEKSENSKLSDMPVDQYVKISGFPITDYYLESSCFSNSDWKDKAAVYRALNARFLTFKDRFTRHLIKLKQ